MKFSPVRIAPAADSVLFYCRERHIYKALIDRYFLFNLKTSE